MGRGTNEIMAALPPERHAAVEVRTAELIDEVEGFKGVPPVGRAEPGADRLNARHEAALGGQD